MSQEQHLINAQASIAAMISIGLIGANWVALGVIFNIWLWKTGKLKVETENNRYNRYRR